MHAVPASRSGVFARCLLLFLVGYPQLGCSDAPLTLRVDVRTDYTPIREFESLEVLLGLGSTGAQAQTHRIPVEDSDRFLPAHPVLTTGLDEPGLYLSLIHISEPTRPY